MNRIKKIIVFSVMFCIVAILMYYSQRNEQDLWHDYRYLPLYEAIDIWYPEQTSLIYKAESRYLFNNIKISWDIRSVLHNDNFIVVSMFAESAHVCYVIDKQKDQIIWPLLIGEFKESMNILRIPKWLSCNNSQ